MATRRWRQLVGGSVLAAALAAALTAALAPLALASEAPPPPTARQVTAFFRAVSFDDAATVTRMVGAVVNANQPNPLGGEPALVLAVREGSKRVIEVLLAHPGLDIEQRAVNGNTALMMAAWLGARDTLEQLLAHGARVNQPGWNALHYACVSGNEDIARILIARGAALDAAAPMAAGGYTPLMLAAREGKTALVRLLLDSGARVDVQDAEGLTAEQLAERAGHAAIARLLSQKN